MIFQRDDEKLNELLQQARSIKLSNKEWTNIFDWLISSRANKDDLKRMEHALLLMTQYKLPPSMAIISPLNPLVISTYEVLAESYARRSNHRKVKELMDKMKF